MSTIGKTLTLDPKLAEHARSHPYLAEYLRRIIPQVGPPQFYENLPSSLKKATYVNVIYPIGDGLFVHVYMPPGGTESGYRKYQIIEPPEPPRELIELVEEKMAEYIDENHVSRSIEEKARLLEELLKKSVEVVDGPVDYSKINPRKVRKIPVSRRDYDPLIYYMFKHKIELGHLAPFLKDPYIEDISCDGVGHIFIVHKIFGPLESNVRFDTEEELDRFVLQLSERIGKPASHARPIVDASLPDGSRINIVFGSEVSLRGSNFTIRRVSKVPISVTQLIDWGTFDEYIAGYLWILLSEGMSGFICGETASGKTTTLNAIIAFIRPTAKIVTIEDTAEVQVPHDNWTRELTRDTGSQESSVTMFDLLKAALRQRPNYIIVGEIRGAEGNVAFQAMQTGHPVLATFHAGSVERLVQRITSPPINVAKTMLDNLNFVLMQSAVYREGVMIRRVLSVNEIQGYDPVSDSIIYIPSFVWEPARDVFRFIARGSSYLLEQKIGVARGIPKRMMKLIYDELDLRARILREMVKKKIFNYYDVFRTVVKVYHLIEEKSKGLSKEESIYGVIQGLEESLKRLKRDQL